MAFEAATLRGWRKKAQALRRALGALKHVQYNYAWCPGCRMGAEIILAIFWDIFQKFISMKKIQKVKSQIFYQMKKIFWVFFFS